MSKNRSRYAQPVLSPDGRGARTACLHVADHNDAALRLYAGLGFTPAGTQNVWRTR